jgi:hypothetical protein
MRDSTEIAGGYQRGQRAALSKAQNGWNVSRTEVELQGGFQALSFQNYGSNILINLFTFSN